jgi:hypothetical protein
MKFTQEFSGVIDGEIYPRVFAPGEDCPPELLEAAKSVGAVAKAAHPLEHDGDGIPGGSPAGEQATRRRGRKAKGSEQ